MTKTLLLLSVLALLVLPACGLTFNLANSNRVNGSGNTASETRDVSGFTEVSLEVPSTLYIEQGDTESLTIEADDNVLELIETEVVGSRLTLGIKPSIRLELRFSDQVLPDRQRSQCCQHQRLRTRRSRHTDDH